MLDEEERMATETVVTMVEATVEPARVPDLLEAFPATSAEDLPSHILGTMLLHETESDVWRIVTLWRSMNDLDEYLRAVETPAARQAFLMAGAEPAVSLWKADRVLLNA
jgi:hypothetical protein